MELSCPSCRHPIPLKYGSDTDDGENFSTIASVDCPNCGQVPVTRSADETLTFVRPDPKQPEDVAHFQLIRPLGGGSFGTVWLARDKKLEREVALKLPIGSDPDLDTLLHEARTAAPLHHPNIVAVYEVGSHDDQVFIASEYIDGLTLRDSLSAGRPSFQRTAEITQSIATALQHAHDHGVIHRDVKPANILVDRNGQPRVTDFGLAKRLSADESISANGQILGTARYMAPEQAVGNTRETDHRSDVYAVGVMLFEMLTGELPFRGNVQAVLHQKIEQDAPSPRSLAPAIPRDLETICVRCMAREQSRRYQSAQEVADELGRFLRGEPIRARAISKPERVWRWCRRRPAIAGLIAALFLSLTGGLLGVSTFWLRAEDVAEQNRRALYRSQMNLAAEYAARGDLAGLSRTLDRFRPDGNHDDLRGFEWYYHSRLLSQFTGSWNLGAPVEELALSGDGRLVASLGKDRNITVSNADDGTVLRSLSIEAGRFRTIAFSRTGDWLASGSSDGFLRIWNPRRDDRPRFEIKNGRPVAFVRFSPDGRRVLSASDRGAVRVWDVNTGDSVAEIPTGEGENRDICFGPDGNLIAVAKADGRVRISNVEDGRPVQQLQPNPSIEVLDWSPDGTTLTTGNYSGELRVWSLEDGSLSLELPTGQGKIGDLAYVDAQRVAYVGTAGNLMIIDISSGREVFRADTHSLSHGLLDFSPGARQLAVGSGDGSIKVLSTTVLKSPTVLHHDGVLRFVMLTGDDETLLTATDTGTLTAWNVADGTRKNIEGLDLDSIRLCAAQRNGSLVAVVGSPGRARIHDWKSDKLVASINVPSQEITEIQFTPDDRRLLIGQRGGVLSGLTTDDWTTPFFETSQITAAVNEIAITPDGRTAAVACADNQVRFLDIQTGELLPQSIELTFQPQVATYCLDGQSIAVGSVSGELQIWNGADQTLTHSLKAHTGRINALTAFPDGATIVSTGQDRVIRLWHAESGDRLATFRGHVRHIFSLDVSADGKRIASGALTGDARLWRTGP